MNVAAILKLKGRTVVTTTADKTLLEVAKLLVQHGIGCIVIEGDDGKVAGQGLKSTPDTSRQKKTQTIF